MSTRPAELMGLPGGSCAGLARRVIVIDPDTPWILDPADLKSLCKEHPFDEARFSGRVNAHDRRRTDRLRACVDAGKYAQGAPPMGPEAFLPVAFVIGISGLDSVRAGSDQARRHRRTCARSAPAISARPMCCAPAARLATATLLLDMLKGNGRVIISGYFGGPKPAMLAAARTPFSATSFRCAEVFAAAGRRGLYRRAVRPVLAGPVVFCAVWLTTAFTSRYSRSRRCGEFRHAAVSVVVSATPRWPRYARC